MTVIGTGISWCNSTWNPTVGCSPISSGCQNCYAMALVNGARTRANFGHRFEDVKLHPLRLADTKRFRPIVDADGRKHPHLVFVNSMSDWCYDKIPDEFIHKILDAQEATPSVIYQMLTKRLVRARKILVDRYGSRGIPPNFWIGASVEDNQVGGRINVLRRLKDQTGGNTTIFLSVEPIVGPTDALDMSGCDWVILGGESGGKARIMERQWLTDALGAAQRAGAAIWLKQHGQRRSHPDLREVPASVGDGIVKQFQWLIDNGWELLESEKGGATLDRKTYRQLPASYAALRDKHFPALL